LSEASCGSSWPISALLQLCNYATTTHN